MADGASVIETMARQMLRPQPKVKLYPGDCREVLADMEDESVHMVLTDPPYFLDGLDGNWRKGNGRPLGTGSVGGLPAGMKFDPKQGRDLQTFMEPVADELLRLLKPGGFATVFSAPRLAHRMAVAFEDAGFEIRDVYAWRFNKRAQFKGFTMDHIVGKRKDLNETEKKKLLARIGGRMTPQLRPQFESIICAQKPREGTFADNWSKHEVGLIDAGQTLKGKRPATVMTVEKADRNGHLTPKPLRICEHLIRLFTKRGQTVLDPFLGSGSSCVAAHKAGRHSIGIDVNLDYIQITKQRVEEMTR